MARRRRGPLVFFRFVTRGATPAQPFLMPAFETGKRVLTQQVRHVIATSRSLRRSVLMRRLEDAVRIAVYTTLTAAQRKAPADTGHLRASGSARRVRPLVWTVGFGARYARWVEEGTKGGKIIRPVRARVLAFHWKNAPPEVRRRFRRRGRRR